MTIRTIHDLSRLLRDRSQWPVGFEWNYRDPCQCALGLSRLKHGLRYLTDAHDHYGISDELSERIFIRAAFGDHGEWVMDMDKVTPERVADLIDRLVPRKTDIGIFTAMLNTSKPQVSA